MASSENYDTQILVSVSYYLHKSKRLTPQLSERDIVPSVFLQQATAHANPRQEFLRYYGEAEGQVVKDGDLSGSYTDPSIFSNKNICW